MNENRAGWPIRSPAGYGRPVGLSLWGIWLKQRGVHRAIIPLFLPGKAARALRQGGNTCPQQATGTISWEAWLQQHKRARRFR